MTQQEEYSKSYYVNQRYEEKEVAIKNLYRNLLGSSNLLNGSGKKAVDIGAALGFTVRLLDELGYKSVGLELSRYACEQSELGQRMFQGDIMKPPFDSNAFDLATMFEVIEHIKTPEVALRQIHRILKPNGILLMSTPTKFGNWLLNLFDLSHGHLLNDNRSYNEQHQSILDKNSWGSILNTVGFTNIQTKPYLLTPIIFGDYHVVHNRIMASNIMVKAVKP